MIGTNIKLYMTESGIEQTTLAEKTCISSETIHEILNENRKIQVDEYLAICKALEKPLAYFVGENQTFVR